MYKETRMQTLERELRYLKPKEKVERLWEELRSSTEELQVRDNQLADILDSVQEIVMFGATEIGVKYLNETYVRIRGVPSGEA